MHNYIRFLVKDDLYHTNSQKDIIMAQTYFIRDAHIIMLILMGMAITQNNLDC